MSKSVEDAAAAEVVVLKKKPSLTKALTAKDWNFVRHKLVSDKLDEYLTASPTAFEGINDHDVLSMIPESYVCDKVYFKRFVSLYKVVLFRYF